MVVFFFYAREEKQENIKKDMDETEGEGLVVEQENDSVVEEIGEEKGIRETQLVWEQEDVLEVEEPAVKQEDSLVSEEISEEVVGNCKEEPFFGEENKSDMKRTEDPVVLKETVFVNEELDKECGDFKTEESVLKKEIENTAESNPEEENNLFFQGVSEEAGLGNENIIGLQGEFPEAGKLNSIEELTKSDYEEKQDNSEQNRAATRIMLGNKGIKTKLVGTAAEEEVKKQQTKIERKIYRPIHFDLNVKLEEEELSRDERVYIKAYEPLVYRRKMREAEEKEKRRTPDVKERLSKFRDEK